MMSKIKALTTAGKITLAGILVLVLALGTVVTGAFIKTDPSDPNSKSVTASLFDTITKASDGKETASAEDMDQEMTAAMVNDIEAAPNMNSAITSSLLSEYGDKIGYSKLGNGIYMVPGSFQTMNVNLNDGTNMDAERADWGYLAGLVSYQISDAPNKPVDFTEAQKSEVLSLGLNQFASFTDEEKEGFKLQIIKALLEDPTLFKGHMDLVADQSIGTTEKIGPHWQLYQEFNDRLNAVGINGFYYVMNGKYYTGANDYHKFVFGFIGFLETMDVEVARFTAAPGDHYMLDTWEFGTDRRLKPAGYEEDLPSVVFLFRLKNGKIALMFGANVVDKRPEVLNYTTKTKEVAASYTPSSEPSGKKSSGGGGSTPDNPQPFPPNPNPPGPTPQPETKNPSDDAANAATDWNDDDPGPGPWKPDQGNSKSPTVEGSQAHAYTVVNTDGGNPSLYPTGPSADYTDNGATPDTSAPENQVGIGDGVNHSTVNGGTSTTSSNNTGRINTPPVD